MTDLDPAAIQEVRDADLDRIAFAWHDATCAEGADCRSRVLHGDPRSTPVMPALRAVYDDAVAALITAAREQGRREVASIALTWLDEEEAVARRPGSHWTRCTVSNGTCTCTGNLGELNRGRLARIAQRRAELSADAIARGDR